MGLIFLVGMPRSGTTLLQSILNSSNDIVTMQETHIFNAAKKIMKEHPSNLDKVIANIRVSKRLKKLGLKQIGIFSCREELIKKILELFDSKRKAKGKIYFLEKTPSHLYFLEHIKKNNKDVKIIYMKRGLVKNVKSYITLNHSWQKNNELEGIEAGISRWVLDNLLIDKFMAIHGGFIVNYEGLLDCNLREQILNDLKFYLGVNQGFKTENLSASSSEIVSVNEYWKKINKQDGIINTSKTTELDFEIIEVYKRLMEKFK